jgi:hypothetical protein
MQLTSEKEDAATAVTDLMIAVDREWPPHVFDRMIESAASNIGLSGLDYLRYRESRLERWRELTGFFEGREHAETALNAAIRQELEELFGNRATMAAQ